MTELARPLRVHVYPFPFARNGYEQLAEWQAPLGGLTAGPSLPTAMADKIRKVLNTPVKCDFARGVPLADVLADLGKRTGVSFHIKDEPLKSLANGVQLPETVPLAAALQAIGDLYPEVRFAVRDYGILVVKADHLPPGAVLVENFWKTAPPQPAPAPGAEPSGDKLPPEGLNGTVQEVEPKSGLVVLSFGRDSDLKDGTILEVYRLRPKPVYVGRLRVEKVRPSPPTQALARPVAPLQSSAIQVGDQVSTRIGKGP